MSTTTTNPIVAVGRECGLDETHPFVAKFLGFYEKANPVVVKAQGIVVTDAAQVSLMKEARKARLEIRAIRLETEKCRKETKESALRECQAIDAIAKTLTDGMAKEETRLEEQEKFAERLETQRKATLRVEREAIIGQYGNLAHGQMLEEMTPEKFAELVEIHKGHWERQQEAARKAEEDRKERERVESQERERLRAENARLAAEKAKADAEAAEARRREAEAAKAARDAQAKADRERREREAQEQRRRDEQERARQRAEAAPDAEKITALAEAVRGLTLPAMSSTSGKEFAEAARIELGKLAEWMLEWRDAMTQ